MNYADPWLLICVLVTTISVLWLVVIWIRNFKFLAQNFFFLFFCSAVVVYLQVAPLLSLLSPEVPLSLAVWGLSHPRDYIREYALLQTASLLLFQTPLVYLYFRNQRKPISGPRTLATTPARAQYVALAVLGFLVLFLLVVAKDELFFTRIGSEGAAQRMVDLPFFDYVVYRSYQESALFLIGVLFFLHHVLRTRLPSLAIALWSNIIVYGYISLLNSRGSVMFLVVMLFGWWLTTRGKRAPAFWQLFRLSLLAAVGIYLSIVVINVRMSGGSGSLRLEYFNPIGTSALQSDVEGYNRLDGIDLMARLAPGIAAEGPAWGAAWKSSYWLVGRFIDPQGFDVSRLSMTDTSKGYLMRRYWGWATTDYLSCRLTDMFGNFYLFGFLMLGGIYAGLFVFCRHIFEQPSSGSIFLVGLFVLVNIIMFEGSGDALLFAWVRKLPVLLALVAMRPFIVLRQKVSQG